MQLNAAGRLKRYLGKKELEVLKFNYCLIVRHFSSCKALRNIENIHKPCLKMIRNDYDSGYETLLKISGTSTMQIKKKKTSNRNI